MVNDLALPIGQKVTLPGHFDVPVTLEDARILVMGMSAGFAYLTTKEIVKARFFEISAEAILKLSQKVHDQ